MDVFVYIYNIFVILINQLQTALVFPPLQCLPNVYVCMCMFVGGARKRMKLNKGIQKENMEQKSHEPWYRIVDFELNHREHYKVNEWNAAASFNLFSLSCHRPNTKTVSRGRWLIYPNWMNVVYIYLYTSPFAIRWMASRLLYMRGKWRWSPVNWFAIFERATERRRRARRMYFVWQIEMVGGQFQGCCLHI